MDVIGVTMFVVDGDVGSSEADDVDFSRLEYNRVTLS
jgi:hypothetical protein